MRWLGSTHGQQDTFLTQTGKNKRSKQSATSCARPIAPAGLLRHAAAAAPFPCPYRLPERQETEGVRGARPRRAYIPPSASRTLSIRAFAACRGGKLKERNRNKIRGRGRAHVRSVGLGLGWQAGFGRGGRYQPIYGHGTHSLQMHT